MGSFFRHLAFEAKATVVLALFSRCSSCATTVSTSPLIQYYYCCLRLKTLLFHTRIQVRPANCVPSFKRTPFKQGLRNGLPLDLSNLFILTIISRQAPYPSPPATPLSSRAKPWLVQKSCHHSRNQGHWKLRLAPVNCSPPTEMTVKHKQRIPCCINY